MKQEFGHYELTIKRSPFELSVKRKDDDKWYWDDFKKFTHLMGEDSAFPIQANYPCLLDKTDKAGKTTNPYFLQDFYVARKVLINNPQKHVDIGSRIDGFVTHIASSREIEIFDIRPMTSTIPNIIFKQADLMDSSHLPQNYCDSISCLHALEHFGLGRYGDTIDPDGHIKGFQNITTILKPGGIFYFSVPMGIQRIDFNAHRIFGLPYLMDMVSKDYDILSFAYIDDNCELHTNCSLTKNSIECSFDCNHGCAIYELKKKQ